MAHNVEIKKTEESFATVKREMIEIINGFELNGEKDTHFIFAYGDHDGIEIRSGACDVFAAGVVERLSGLYQLNTSSPNKAVMDEVHHYNDLKVSDDACEKDITILKEAVFTYQELDAMKRIVEDIVERAETLTLDKAVEAVRATNPGLLGLLNTTLQVAEKESIPGVEKMRQQYEEVLVKTAEATMNEKKHLLVLCASIQSKMALYRNAMIQ